ncbi:13327_t:CDS:2, partial [Ambispora leptoticha]
MKKNLRKSSKLLSRTITNIDKRRKIAVKQLQTQALVISSEEYVERSQGARSIIARGLLPNEDSQAPHDVQNDNPESTSDEEGNISPCELASIRKAERHLLLYKKTTDDKNYIDDEVDEDNKGTDDENYTDDEVDEDKNSSDDEVYRDNIVDEDSKKKISEIPLQEKQRKEINDNFNSMVKDKMWKLSSGRYVEKELYELGKKLDYE